MSFIEDTDSFSLAEFNDQWKTAGDTFTVSETESRWYPGINGTYIEPFDVDIATIVSGVALVARPPFRGTQMADWYMAVGDTAPYIRGNLTQNGENVDLTDATVEFKMWRNSQMLVEEAATVVTASDGLVEYQWNPGDSDLPGMHEAKFVVTWPDDSIQSFPGKGVITIQIEHG